MPAGRQGFSQIILVIIVGAAVVIAGGSFWYYQRSAEQNKSTSETQTTPEPPSVPSTEQNKSASGTQATPEPSSTPAISEYSSIKTSPAPVEQEKQADQNTVSKTPTQTNIPTKQVPAPTDTVLPSTPSAPNNISCAIPTNTAHMDIFDSHVHIMTKISTSQVISEMDKAGVSMSLLYPIDGNDDSSSLEAISKYPGRFITFVDTPDSPQPSTWLTQGQTFITFAEAQLKTGKFYGIGETNLRYYSGNITPPPTVYVPADASVWLQLVDLSAQYHVPISFHFVPDDAVANVAFEKMLNHNKDTILIWAHLGFNNMPLNSATLNDYLLKYPNLYFDTAGIQNMQNSPPKPNSNWALLADQSNNGKLKEEWKQFFETWNSRILFGSDAGGGSNGLERWLNYTDNSSDGAPSDAVGHWKSLLSYLDSNAARNIFSANARGLFLKEQKPTYNYSVSSGGKCHSISISSNSSVSALTFNPSTRAITFTVADSNGTTGSATVIIPTALAGGNFTVSVDGQSVKSQLTSNSTSTTVSLEYAGGIRSITLSAPNTP